jgi:hypothetical protein
MMHEVFNSYFKSVADAICANAQSAPPALLSDGRFSNTAEKND